MKRFAVLAMILILTAACQSAPQTVASQTVVIDYGNLEATISASGSLAARAQTTLAFQTAGPVKSVNVKAGDSVKAGDILAQLEAPDLEISLQRAEIALEIARINLEQTRQGPRQAQVQVARANLASAEASYRAALAKAPYQQDSITQAQEALDRAQENLNNAQAAYDKLDQSNRRGQLVVEFSPQKTALENAKIEYNTALANYRLAVAGFTDNSIKSAEMQVAQAQAQLDKLLSTPTARDIAAAEAQVKQAEFSVQQARKALDRAIITAPHAGIVAQVNIQPGLWATANSAAIVLVDLSQFQLEVLVSETDIARVRVGQSVHVTLDALSGVSLAAHVTSIAPAATVTQGVVNYAVKITLDEADPALRPGMTAVAAIVVDERQNVLLAPNRAIKSSGQTKFVNVQRGNQVVTTTVTLGLVGETYSEVLAGLQAGDTVIVPGTTTVQQTGPMMMGGGPVMIEGGGPPPGDRFGP